MNTSNNYYGMAEVLLDSNEDFEPYGCAETNETLEKLYNDIESYKAGFGDREYLYDH